MGSANWGVWAVVEYKVQNTESYNVVTYELNKP